MGILLHSRQTQIVCGAASLWTCAPSSTQQQFSGCCSVDPCKLGGICPSANQPSQNCDTTAGYLPWVCAQTSTQKQYRGCCKVDACQNGGECPVSARQPVGSSSSSSSGSGSTTRQSATQTGSRGIEGPKSTTITITSLSTDGSGAVYSATFTYIGVLGQSTDTQPTASTPTASTPTPTSTPTSTPTTTPIPSPTSTTSTSKGAIIGGAVGGAVFLLLLLLLAAFLLLRRRRRSSSENSTSPLNDKPTHTPPQGLGIIYDTPPRTFLSSLLPSKKRPPQPPPPSPPTLAPQGILEMPSPSFPPPSANTDLPYNHAELDSDTVTSPSEMSTPLGGNRGSGYSAWTPTPVRSESGASTTAVLSPMRENRHSGGSGEGSSTQGQGLRGGGAVMRSNLLSVRRPVPGRQREEEGGSSRHVLSWMEYQSEDGGTGTAR